MAVFWGFFSFLFFKLKNSLKTPLVPLLAGGIFVLVEYVRAWGFSFLWAGNGSAFGPHWTLGNPAYLLNFWPILVKTSSFWGIYGIDFIIIFFLAGLLLSFKNNRQNRKIWAAEMLLMFLAVLAAGNSSNTNKQATPSLKVTVIQTKNPTKADYLPEEILNNFGQQNILLRNAAKNSDIIVFPETSNFSKTVSGFFTADMIEKYFDNLAPKSILVVDSNRVSEPYGLKSKAIFIDSKNGIAGFYDKKLLTPGGEFLPYLLKAPLYFIGSLPKNNPEFTAGSGNNIIVYKNNNIKVLVCSDIISPPLVREGGFDFILNLNSMSIFRENGLIASQIRALAKFRAAENGKYLVIASNYGRSYVISPYGKIEKSTPETGYQLLTADIVPNKARTWYNKLGDLPILLLSLAICGLSIKNYWNAKQD